MNILIINTLVLPMHENVINHAPLLQEQYYGG